MVVTPPGQCSLICTCSSIGNTFLLAATVATTSSTVVPVVANETWSSWVYHRVWIHYESWSSLSQYSYSVAMAFPCSGFHIVIWYVGALQLGILSISGYHGHNFYNGAYSLPQSMNTLWKLKQFGLNIHIQLLWHFLVLDHSVCNWICRCSSIGNTLITCYQGHNCLYNEVM